MEGGRGWETGRNGAESLLETGEEGAGGRIPERAGATKNKGNLCNISKKLKHTKARTTTKEGGSREYNVTGSGKFRNPCLPPSSPSLPPPPPRFTGYIGCTVSLFFLNPKKKTGMYCELIFKCLQLFIVQLSGQTRLRD